MSDTEIKAFRQIGTDLINEYRERGGLSPITFLPIHTPEVSAFIRSIQLHENTKEELQGVKQEFDDFKQKVSDAVVQAFPYTGIMPDCLGELIIPKPNPDPLVSAMDELEWCNTDTLAKDLRAELDALGFEIREKNDG